MGEPLTEKDKQTILELRRTLIPPQIRELKAEFLGLLVRECDAKGQELNAIQKRKEEIRDEIKKLEALLEGKDLRGVANDEGNIWVCKRV